MKLFKIFPRPHRAKIPETAIIRLRRPSLPVVLSTINPSLAFWGYTYNHMTLRERIAPLIKGDVSDDPALRKQMSRTTSIFEIVPELIVYPKDTGDVAALTTFVHEARKNGENISLTARSAGTDMSGGSQTASILMIFTKYMNQIGEIGPDYAETEPGVYYRDFEKATLATAGKILPSYPASRELCAMGGIVSNNSGGELTLRYGKTNKYIERLDVVLSDGTQASLSPIPLAELPAHEAQPGLLGSIYRDVHALIRDNRETIEAARPTVTKNSAGYALWNVLDESHGTFDLTQLICGAQGTLVTLTKARLELIETKKHKAMLVVFLTELTNLPEIVHRVLKLEPESFESYDDKTFSLAVKLMPQMLKQMGLWKALQLGFAFIPEVVLVVTGGVPKLVLMAEFAEDTAAEAFAKAERAQESLKGIPLKARIERSEIEAEKFWKVRRESFALLRKNSNGLYAAPFIDDFVVHPDDYPTFLPELLKLMEGRHFIHTITGHIGDGNFHIIPLVDMSDPEARADMLDVTPKVYELIGKYHGSITGEHNDGIIRTPYLPMMFKPEMIELFARIKQIFDPLGVLNPGKKVGASVQDIERLMITKM